jgi:nucleoside recognition membrane protein YjiH
VSRFSFLGTCLYPPHFRRTGSIALVVGTWLTLFNQGDVIWDGQVGGWIWIKIVLNYLTPFLVANLGLLSKRREQGGPKKQREPT